ncbi:DNA binding,ATP binding,nucleic acid bindin isoform 1 [Hibiscus syriacus]|uniref:DNA binding,ATP binding,nucleic acid bindin isoform 1 n=1 Tax=Hibiscus syriacus TaxID=106335 RepID=A0A6A2YJ26_HIBSY|nr:DNA binding,ATP binding,nucleic acid bindin isoform 1 [Hibiscus syriacus]
MAGGEEGETLEFTPTWIVSVVCTVIVAISLAMERLLHVAGVVLKKKHQKPLYEALSKVKEDNKAAEKGSNSETTSHFQTYFASTLAGRTRIYAPLLTVEALHHLDIFIFVLTIVHVVFCVLTVSIGGLKIRLWKRWEDSIAKENYDSKQVQCRMSNSMLLSKSIFGVLHSLFKQFSVSVTKSDYVRLRLGFIMMHCRGNPKFNFHKYMIQALEDDFKHVAGMHISGFAFIPVIVQYGFDSCVMGQVRYIVPRLVIGVFVQVLCSFSTLPLYAIVTQKAIFDEHVQVGLVGWAQKAKKKKGLKATGQAAAEVNPEENPSNSIQIGRVVRNASDQEEINSLHGSN